MGVGILVQNRFPIHMLFVNCHIRTHSSGSEIFCNILLQKCNLFFPCKLNRKCHFNFPCKLGIRFLFHFLHLVPENFPVLIFPWCIGWEKNLRIDYTAFPCVIVSISCFLFFQFSTCPVSRCGNCAFPGTAAEHLNGKMKNRHRTTSPYDIEKPHRWVLLYHFAVSGTQPSARPLSAKSAMQLHKLLSSKYTTWSG